MHADKADSGVDSRDEIKRNKGEKVINTVYTIDTINCTLLIIH